MTLLVLALLTALAAEGYRRFREDAAVDRAARAVAGDVALARSLAVQRQSAAVLALDASVPAYAVLDTSEGTADTLLRRSMGPGSALPIGTLVLEGGGDRLVFDRRGLLLVGGAPSAVALVLARGDRRRRVVVTPLGRTRIETP